MRTILNARFSRLLAAGLIIVVTACGTSNDQTNSEGVSVVATTTILGDLIERLVGDAGTVDVLMPVGSDPHEYQLSARQVADIERADLVVTNGLGLEGGMSATLSSAATDGANILELAPLLDPLVFSTPDDGNDPHVWLDPVRMADGVEIIASALAEVDDSLEDAEWERRGAALAGELLDTHSRIEQTLSVVSVDRRVLVTNHLSFGYFADRYGFEVVGTVIPGGSTLAEPSSGELADLVATITRLDIPAIFVETTEPSLLADAVAKEVDFPVAVIELYSGSLDAPDTPAGTYTGMLEVDAERIASALE